MKCQEALQLLQHYSDGELDLVRQIQMEEHITECAEQEKHLRSLRAVIVSPSLYHRAPTGLRERIQLTATPVTPVVRVRKRSSANIAALAVGVLLLIGASAAIGTLWSARGASADDRLTEFVVASHVRSLQAEHLRDVASTDQHTVKQWFQNKLDFAPQVPNLAPQGYPLSGGRLDYLADRPVAALVYNRGLHTINLFEWPAANDEEKAVRSFARQGFHIRSWQRSGMTYWAISDLNDREFDEFVRLIREQTSE